MKRMAGVCVTLAILSGCSYFRQDPDCRECTLADLLPLRPPAPSQATGSQREIASRSDKLMLVPAGPIDPPPSATTMRPSLSAGSGPQTARSSAELASATMPNTLPPALETTSCTNPPVLQPMASPVSAPAPVRRVGNLEKAPASELPKSMPPQVAAAVQSLTITSAEGPTGPSLDTSEPKPAKPKEVKPGGNETASAWTPTAIAASPSPALSTSGPVVRLVNKKRIMLNYEIKDVGPSGVSGVELWYTRDAKNWQRQDGTLEKKPPYIIEVQEEGLYGFTLLAKNGIGLSKDPPASGDLPQVWVEVDLTRPTVALTEIKPVYDNKLPALTIQWKASDKNFGGRPITLSYSEKEDGPWQPMATNIENSGRYVWRLRPDLPPRIYVRLEAKDLAGNVAVVQTPSPVQVDLSRPVVNVLDVEGSSQ